MSEDREAGTSGRRRRTQAMLARARGGDASAYEELFAHVRSRLELYIGCRLGRLRHRLDPADVLQDVYLEAHRAFPSLESPSAAAFGAWLYRIADHTLSRLRDRHEALKRGGDARQASPSAIGRVASETDGPRTETSHREDHERLLTAMQALDERERDVLLLRYVQELTLAQVAERLGSSTSTVARVQDRALERLSRKLGYDFRERL